MKPNPVITKSTTDEINNIQFGDIFILEDIQRLQDLFSDAFGVASIITQPNGVPITNPSNFCRLCNNIIRKTEKGRVNCFESDAVLGGKNLSFPVVQPCLSAGLWGAIASITVGNKHIANWIIGQVRNEEVDEQQMLHYADEIGVNREDFIEALKEVPVMPVEQFNKVSKMLFAFAKEISEKAYTNLQLKLQIAELKKATELLQESKELLSITLQSIGDAVIATDKESLITMMNPTAERLTGWNFNDAKNQSFHRVFNIINATTRETIVDSVEKVIESGKVTGLANHTILISRDGREYQIADSAAPILDNQGNVLGVILVFSDVTEKYQSEEALKANISLLNASLQSTADGLLMVNSDGKINRWNQKFADMWHIPEKVLATYDDDYVISNILAQLSEPEHFLAKVRYLYAHQEESSFDQIIFLDGRIFERYSQPKRIGDDIVGRVWSFRDVTERKQAEEALKESENKYRELVENSPDAIVIYVSGKIVFANKETLHVIAATSEEDLIGKPVLQFVHPDSRALVIERMRKGASERTVLPLIEEKFVRLDGSVVEVEVKAMPIVLENKPAVQLIIRDITERKKAEANLQISEKKYRNLVENALIGIYTTTLQGTLLFANNAMCKMLEYDSIDELINTNVNLFYKNKEHREKLIEKIIKEKQIFNHELELITKKDNTIYVEVNSFISGEIITGLMMDISSRKRAEEELISAKEKAEESDRLKSSFLANMSHEIRTPMNGIMGLAQIMKDPDLTIEQQQEYLSIIEKSGVRMLNIINDIIDISKIESGQMKVCFSETNINEQIEYIYTFFKPEVERKGIRLIFNNTLPAKKAIIKTDKGKVYSILTNLVNNAVKFTHAGSIEFGYNLKAIERKTTDDLREHFELEFFVKDTGVGIPHEQQEIIFERFRQGSESLTRNYEGAGLGLAIAKAYTEMLGGKIWVESEARKGSTFYFTIPYNQETKEKHTIKNDTSNGTKNKLMKKLKILIVEDDEASERYLSLVMKMFAKEVITVRTGFEAIDACRNNPGIDLVLMDIKIPKMDGYEATRQIRQFNTNVVIIAQTAYALWR